MTGLISYQLNSIASAHNTKGYLDYMQFGPSQKKRFNCSDGAYSTVTDREYKDSQITLTDHEASIVLSRFTESGIPRGGVNANPELAAKEFALYPSGESIQLNINFPKSKGNELRLYLNRQFRPEGGLVVFLFPADGRLWIGTMTESEWRTGSADLVSDDSDSVYQESLTETSEIRIATLKERDVYVRDRSIAIESMKNSGYVCEFNSTHELFISRRSGKPYLEAHHLIPMEFQSDFETSLDIVENIFCLCPNCHRAVHHAIGDTSKQILNGLIGRRDALSTFKLNEMDLHALYVVEEII